MAKGKRKVPDINSSSTADIAFLLLIFFLITTSMDTDRGLARRLPPPPETEDRKDDSDKVKERNVMTVFLNMNDQLMCSGEYVNVDQLRDKAKEFIAPEYMAYISGRNVRMRQENAGDTEESKRTDRFTQKVLGIGLGLSGVLITVLGFIAEENIVVPVAVGLVVTLIGIYLLILSLRRLL